MNIANVIQGERGLRIIWDDQLTAALPFVWLPDNDSNDLHPTARERVFRSNQYRSISAHEAHQTAATHASRTRAALNPISGERHLRGYQIERNEIDTRIRVLTREEI